MVFKKLLMILVFQCQTVKGQNHEVSTPHNALAANTLRRKWASTRLRPIRRKCHQIEKICLRAITIHNIIWQRRNFFSPVYVSCSGRHYVWQGNVNVFRPGASSKLLLNRPLPWSCVCLSVRLSVTRRYCVKTVKRRTTRATPRHSRGILFSDTNSCWWADPQSPPFGHNDFDQYPIIASQPWHLATKSSVSSTNRKLTTRFPISHGWTVHVTLSPQRVALNAILLFLSVKFNFCRKKSATKFLCVKTSRAKL